MRRTRKSAASRFHLRALHLHGACLDGMDSQHSRIVSRSLWRTYWTLCRLRAAQSSKHLRDKEEAWASVPAPRLFPHCIKCAALEYLILEAARPALESVPGLLPKPLDDPRIVIAVAQIVIESREAMLLTCLLHLAQLAAIELVSLNVAPVISRGIHRKTGSHGPIGPYNHIVLTGAAVPVRKAHGASFIPHNPRHTGQQPLGAGVIPFCARIHPHERLHLLQTGH